MGRTVRYRDVIQHCNEVLRRDEHNVKALFRRSKAYEQVGDLRAALSDAKEAAAAEPQNVHVQRRVSDRVGCRSVGRGGRARIRVEGKCAPGFCSFRRCAMHMRHAHRVAA